MHLRDQSADTGTQWQSNSNKSLRGRRQSGRHGSFYFICMAFNYFSWFEKKIFFTQYIRSGTHSRQPKLPYTPGLDSAGIITKLGKNVKNFSVGDRVFTVNSDTGTYAEYALSMPVFTFKLNEKLSFEAGSGLGVSLIHFQLKTQTVHFIKSLYLQVPYFTAYRALFIK